MKKWGLEKKIIVEILCKWMSYVVFYFKSNSYVLYCLSDEKVKIWKKSIFRFCWNRILTLFYYFKSNSYVFVYLKSLLIFCANRILMFSFILNRIPMHYIVKVMKKWGFEKNHIEIFCKWISYVFFYFRSNSDVLYCLSDEKVRTWKKKNHCWNFVQMDVLCCLLF